MTVEKWDSVLPSAERLRSMSEEELEAVQASTHERAMSLALGISGLGNLLSCAATNEESGLSEDAVHKVGWMLESLGELICALNDRGASAAWMVAEHAKKRMEQPESVLAHRPGKATLDCTNVRAQS